MFVVSGGQVLVEDTPDGGAELVMMPTFEAPESEVHRYFLGIDAPSRAVAPLTFGSVAPDLFKAILGGGMQAAKPPQHTHAASQRAEQ